MGKRHAGRGEQCGRWFATRSRIAWGTCDETCGSRQLRSPEQRPQLPLRAFPVVTNATHDKTDPDADGHEVGAADLFLVSMTTPTCAWSFVQL